MKLEDQLKTYADQIETAQRPVSGDEALHRVNTVRIGDAPQPTAPSYARWQKLAVPAAIAAIFAILFGTSLWFTKQVVPTDDPAAPTSTATTQTIDLTSSMQRIDTPLGTWVWQRTSTPFAGIAELNGIFYSVEGPRQFDEQGNPSSQEDWSIPPQLLTSADGVSWEESTLPGEMAGHYLGLSESNGLLIIVGRPTDSPQTLRAWSTPDGTTWSETSDYPSRNPLALSAPGISASGASVVVRHDDPVKVGNAQLVHGTATIRFPEEVIAAIQGIGGSQMDTIESDDGLHFLIWTTDTGDLREPNPENPDIEVVVAMTESADGGMAIDYQFWAGPATSGDLFHAAQVVVDSDLDVDSLNPDDALHPWFELMWRTGEAGEFELVRIPVERAARWQGYGSRIQHLAAIDNLFVLYGAAPNGPSTKVNDFVTRAEPSRIATIATSVDGLSWETQQIDGLVTPQSVRVTSAGPTIWSGEFATWISTDGLTGNLIDVSAFSWITDGPGGTFMMVGDSSIRISQDVETWFSIPLPTHTDQQQRGIAVVGGRLFYSVGSEENGWVGHLEP